MTVTGVTLGGAAAGNYTVAQPTGLTADITAKGLTVEGAKANTKIYDGDAHAGLDFSGATMKGVVGQRRRLAQQRRCHGRVQQRQRRHRQARDGDGRDPGGAAAGNYTVAQPTGLKADITARAITVTADAKTKVYGENDPALTAKVTAGELVNADKLSGDLARENGENVGPHDITQGTLTAGSNYELHFEGAKLTITARAITVTADAKTKVYGEDDPALTAKVTAGELVNADKLSGDLARENGENVGPHDITQGTLTAGSNYELTSWAPS